MAETKITRKKTEKLTPFQQEQLETFKKINEYKLGAEASVVAMIYKNPDLLRENKLELDDFSNNCWRVYFEIAKDMILNEKKLTLSLVDVGLYLEKHPKLSKKYDEYGGYDTIERAGAYVDESNFESYVYDLHKWCSVNKLVQRGFPCKHRLSEFCDMDIEDIYSEFEIYLNDIFSNIDHSVKSVNGFEGMKELIDKLDKGKNVGIPFANCDVLNKETGGMVGSTIIGLGAASGIGKSTLSINYIFPSMIKYNLKALFIINEENQEKFQKEALCWYCTNVLKHPVPKHVLRDGNFDQETKETLYKAAEWFESQKEKRNITIIPMENYTAQKTKKILKKYTKLNVDVIVLDTLKESYDSRGDETWKSVMRDTTDYYEIIKSTKTCMFITYQLTKNRSRYLSHADIGISKGIIDVFSLNLLARRPMQDEYEGGKNELTCYKIQGKSKIPFKLKKDTHYMIIFINKNRQGNSDIQIVSEADFSINKFGDLGYCLVAQDY